MIDVRPFAGLGHAHHGWLETAHHFSFSNYHDPARMGWGRLRVWNDDVIAPNSGFPPHSHDNMEIITYVRSGAISHQDSLGNRGRTSAGDVQVMSAGTGITHAEFNAEGVPCTLFQIWIETDRPGSKPNWETRSFPSRHQQSAWEVLASSQSERDQGLAIAADAKVLAASLRQGQRLAFAANPQRYQYLVAASGRVTVNGIAANARDGIAMTGERHLAIIALDDAELVMVDSA